MSKSKYPRREAWERVPMRRSYALRALDEFLARLDETPPTTEILEANDNKESKP